MWKYEKALQYPISIDKKDLKMAKYIMNTAADYCSDCCADYKTCNERYDERHNALLPPEEVCIRNIINYFEK